MHCIAYNLKLHCSKQKQKIVYVVRVVRLLSDNKYLSFCGLLIIKSSEFSLIVIAVVMPDKCCIVGCKN